jgi:hypothetical protein
MAVFTVHAPSDAAAGPARTAFVREAFSWAAFLAAPLWLAAHRAWLALVLWCLGFLAVVAVAAILDASPAAMSLALLAFGLLFGLEAPAVRQRVLRRRGFRHVASVVADDAEGAERAFFAASRTAPESPTPVEGPAPRASAGPFLTPDASAAR